MTICSKTLEAVKYEKGTFGWLKEQAKKDGFNSIYEWNKHKYMKTEKKIIRRKTEKLKRRWQITAKMLYAKKIKCHIPEYRHEKLAFPYLQSIGYDISDIKINNSRSGGPDITTCDGKEWEVKMDRSSFLVFSKSQLDNFSDNVQILIYGKYESRGYPLKVISFGDFKKGLSVYHTKTTKNRIIYLRKSGYLIGFCHQEFVYNEQNKLIDVKTSYLRV